MLLQIMETDASWNNDPSGLYKRNIMNGDLKLRYADKLIAVIVRPFLKLLEGRQLHLNGINVWERPVIWKAQLMEASRTRPM
jgi:hypothetical protein